MESTSWTNRHLSASALFFLPLPELGIDLLKEVFGILEDLIGHVRPELPLLRLGIFEVIDDTDT